VSLSLPSVLGQRGVLDVLTPDMSEEELRALEHSAERLRDALAKSRTGQ
jgi:malate/lactate dehydrogenase